MATVQAQAETSIILITYEFTFSTFSGNGILARSLVKSLLRQGCRVLVWCCRPPPSAETSTTTETDGMLQVPELSRQEYDRLQNVSTTISTAEQWRRLDVESAWEEFVWTSLDEASQSQLLGQGLLSHKQKATAVLVIDWTGHSAYQSMPFHDGLGNHAPPMIYLNFRVYSSGVSDPTQKKWYDAREKAALEDAALVVALSENDKASLVKMVGNNSNNNNNDSSKETHVLVPPLRGDVEELARQPVTTEQLWKHLPAAALEAATRNQTTHGIEDMTGNRRPRKCFLTCVVRLSPEKNTRRFVHFVRATQGFWRERNWIPLLAGASSDPAYAKGVQEELRQICGEDGCVILDSFLPPAALAAVFSCAVVNLHPCSYDAYGMTIMEAAAFGVPSIVAQGNHVGATVHVGNGASIQVPMEGGDDDNSDPDGISQEAVDKILESLGDPAKLEELGNVARERAFAWGETAYGKALLQLISNHKPMVAKES